MSDSPTIMMTTTTTTTADRPGPAAEAHRSAWVHICNGLDPRHNGGMVPSILGMTGGLAARGRGVRIVTPTPSRLEAGRVPRGVRLDGPEADLEAAVRGAEVVHIHGLWQGHTRRASAKAPSEASRT